ncbi:FtsH protease activity modulator HflK [Aureimonas phyllosphaerae]|uniref:Protein HflK n=1 Tax=Aureimonas phyllosphaerae TaxID=1166078 RepID=A0A7W6BWT6_9HYPH|nr:FtsH protease activity modulator HflK [Aureimonas phyllosphaerae]MBB3936598.1 membrane protease subunit HflK [Aureimonas phyllosphaerae]MBB3960538.1 membrane protease subunit HflK [Aureimonas phyllosphaerae]SFF24329.1 protease FtsH subunit HflK [Aureimonas phyllosphaerae]
MPWSNQTGNGGWKGGGGGGPWGQGPQGPRPGGNNNSPDLEDILRRGQDRLRRAMPGGGGGRGQGAGGGAAIAGLAVAGLAVVWLLNAVYTVQPDEVGVELLFGKPNEQLSEPGLHFVLWPFETVETVKTSESQMVIGSNQGGDGSGLMLSGDQNIVDVQFTVNYQVANPDNFLFNVQDPPALLRQVAESAMREVVGRRPVEDIFRDDRAGIAEQVRAITQDTLNTYGAGLQVNAITIQDAAPPSDVADAFEEVQRAEQNEAQFVDEARRYQNEQLGRSQGEAVQIREDAAAYKNRVVQEAQGESQRFTAILGEYEKAPEITRQRLYFETMEGVLGNSSKVIMDPSAGGGQGVVPYLPLNELPRPGAQSPNAVGGTRTIQPSNTNTPDSSVPVPGQNGNVQGTNLSSIQGTGR